MNSANPVTYVALAGGLGNQLFQLAAGLYVAGDAPLLLLNDLSRTRQHVSGAPDLAKFKLPGNVSLKTLNGSITANKLASTATSALLRGASANQSMFDSHAAHCLIEGLSSPLFHSILGAPVTVFGGRGVSYDARLARKQSSQLLIGYFQTWRYVADMFVTANMRNLLLDAVPSWLDDLAETALLEKPIVVHVRLGDYRKNPNIGLVTPEYIHLAINYHRAHGHSGRIWLFSDEPEQAMEFLPPNERNAGPRLVTAPKGGEHPANTLAAMSLGKAFVLSNSTFGWWAGWRSATEGKNIIVPSPWFAGNKNATDVVFSDWVQVQIK